MATQAKQQAKEREEQERQQAVTKTFVSRWEPVWNQLDAAEQDDIIATVSGTDNFLRKHHREHSPTMQCLQELARRRPSQPEDTLTASPATPK